MEHFSDSMAWLAKHDGSLVIGHGPFSAAASPPVDGVAFYVQDFAMGDPLPWKIPARSERIFLSAYPPQTATVPLECDWELPEPGDFSVVFQDVMSAIHSGLFEKTVPVVT